MWTSAQKNGGLTLFTSTTSWADLQWPIPGTMFLIVCMLGSFGSLVYTHTMVQQGEADWYDDFYIKPWCRYTPYAIGTLLGYIMFKTKCNVKMSKPIVVVYWAITIAMLSWPIWVSTSSWFPKEAYVTYESTRRIGFSLGVSMLIFACTTGYGGMVNTFLSWRFFIPLTRLTYISYLLHPIVLGFFQYNSHQMIYVNDTNVVLYAGGVMFYTLALSFILTLVFEVPMLALEKVIIPKAKQ
ncbi:hypothetical protein CAPTEDRAFT_203767 [Capitella teleta]|uniref:Acyltransferase 3 domain-containing protein n=1 Tax=Capitella teleta TaxID=283909 RepID=R7T7B8_CAPTE|nr:hypothetical protein CAPTEDRAFT_203767 [Capitella teleta]|eukprot:ELT89539.1 hypothetical protein CAPTEDRAFT_203767 [Capitella teleta]